MINQQKITIDWIQAVSQNNRNADKILVEKVIRALLLLEGLVKQKLPFVFKGGTSLMLHFNSTRRLSIDIDIILPEAQTNLEELLEQVVKEQGFIRNELQHRSTHTKIIKEHYKFFYIPLHKTNKEEEYVLLDILFEATSYTNLIQLPILSSFTPIKEEPLMVVVPSLEDLLGDKLTAFAPNTTGIPYFKNEDSMSMEIIKQLYDIGNLFDVVTDVKTIKKTFNYFAKTELDYRSLSELNEQDVLDDIYQTSLCIASKGLDGKGNFEELQLGIRRITNFIFSENYHLEKTVTHASKAAYMATILKYNENTIEKYTTPALLKDWTITEPLNNKLNKLKKSNTEAFFYWYKIYNLTIQHT